ncbi:unnamed protein product [Boreogadus saida]
MLPCLAELQRMRWWQGCQDRAAGVEVQMGYSGSSSDGRKQPLVGPPSPRAIPQPLMQPFFVPVLAGRECVPRHSFWGPSGFERPHIGRQCKTGYCQAKINRRLHVGQGKLLSFSSAQEA